MTMLKRWAARARDNHRKGSDLERRVKRILESEGRPNVRTNVLLKDKNGNLSEIDVMCGYRFIPGSQLYIECKAYKKGNAVSLDAVSKFKEVLLLNGIPLHRGLVVTTSRF